MNRDYEVVHSGDDPEEVFKEFKRRKTKGEQGIAFAEVRFMLNPPKTKHKYVVIKTN